MMDDFAYGNLLNDIRIWTAACEASGWDEEEAQSLLEQFSGILPGITVTPEMGRLALSDPRACAELALSDMPGRTEVQVKACQEIIMMALQAGVPMFENTTTQLEEN